MKKLIFLAVIIIYSITFVFFYVSGIENHPNSIENNIESIENTTLKCSNCTIIDPCIIFIEVYNLLFSHIIYCFTDELGNEIWQPIDLNECFLDYYNKKLRI